MHINNVYTVLKDHQHWRRCNDEKCECEASNPSELGAAIDFVLILLQESIKSPRTKLSGD